MHPKVTTLHTDFYNMIYLLMPHHS